MPPRHFLIHIPPGRGLTHANLARLNNLWTRAAEAGTIENIENYSTQIRNLENKIQREGGFPNRNATLAFLRPLLRRYERLNNRVHRMRNINEEKWRRVQNAAGRFKTLTRVAAVRTVNRPGSRAVANLLRNRLLGLATPVMTRRNNYLLLNAARPFHVRRRRRS